jgi:hypothetical protein
MNWRVRDLTLDSPRSFRKEGGGGLYLFSLPITRIAEVYFEIATPRLPTQVPAVILEDVDIVALAVLTSTQLLLFHFRCEVGVVQAFRPHFRVGIFV